MSPFVGIIHIRLEEMNISCISPVQSFASLSAYEFFGVSFGVSSISLVLVNQVIGGNVNYYSGPYLRQLKTGKWQGIIKYKDKDGKWKSISKVSQQKLKRDAKVELEAWKEEQEHLAAMSPDFNPRDRSQAKVTIQQKVTEYLDLQLSLRQLERSTYDVQMNNCHKRIFPYLGSIPYRSLTPADIDNWVTLLNNDGLKQNTIYKNFATLRKCYNYFEFRGEIQSNPFNRTKAPKASGARVTYLSKRQMADLLFCLNEQYKETDPFYIAIELATLSGLRRGEICGLRWVDIDFKEKKLSVTSAIGVSTKMGTYTKAPKTKASIRTFPMIPQLEEILQNAYSFQEQKYGEVQNSWFVCGRMKKYMNPTTLTHDMKNFTHRNNLKDVEGNYITIHSLRHNFANLGVESKMDISSLSYMLGHSNASMTLDIYASANEEGMKKASRTLAEDLSKKLEYLNVDVDEYYTDKEKNDEPLL